MKKHILSALCVLMLGACLTTAEARKQPVPHMYMFGMAASFNDTIIHFTDIQELDSVWIETKNNFLLERSGYSSQLRDFLTQQQQMGNRTCIVFYNQKRSKLQKEYEKVMRLYTKSKDGQQHFDIRHLDPQQFHFTTIDLTDAVSLEQEIEYIDEEAIIREKQRKQREQQQ